MIFLKEYSKYLRTNREKLVVNIFRERAEKYGIIKVQI